MLLPYNSPTQAESVLQRWYCLGSTHGGEPNAFLESAMGTTPTPMESWIDLALNSGQLCRVGQLSSDERESGSCEL